MLTEPSTSTQQGSKLDKAQTPSKGWLVVGGEDRPEIEVAVQAAVAAQIAKGAYPEGTIAHMLERKLALVNRTLQISDQHLVAIRRVSACWDIQLTPPQISSHRRIIGPIIVGVKRLLFPLLSILLKDLLRKQREFNAAVLEALVEIAAETTPEKQNSKLES